MSGRRQLILMAEDERDGGRFPPGFLGLPFGGCALIGRAVAGVRVWGWPPVYLE